MRSLRLDVLGATFVIVWTSGYVVGALATQVLPPLTVTLWRFALAALVLAAIATFRHESWPRGRQLLAAAGIGLPLFAVQFGALYTSLGEGTPAGTVALVACSSPLLVALIAAALRWDRLSAVRWFGIVLGVLGVLITLSDRVGQPPSTAALGWTVLGMAGLAVGTLAQSRLSRSAGPAAISAVELASATVVLAVWAPLKGSLAIPVTAHALVSFVWLALVTGVGAPLLLFALIRKRGATRASSLLFLVPGVTTLLGWPLLGTTPSVLTIAGLAVAGVGLWLARSRPADDTTRPAATSAGPTRTCGPHEVPVTDY